ncbi:MAG: GNAT family N-acetyltransferase [Proteobacteria bacterium]|nr:GNAT family N-acetyltransferase [Pseudomonadota bacterium]
MEIQITEASDTDFASVCNMGRFYVYDMSEFTGWGFGADGSYDLSANLGKYWGRRPENDERPWPADWRGFPFLIRADGELAGFGLVKQIGPSTFDMGEFFVARKFRRHGVGQIAATRLFDKFKGRWEVRELLTNTPAQSFWRRIISAYADGRFNEAQEHFAVYGRDFVVQRFESR